MTYVNIAVFGGLVLAVAGYCVLAHRLLGRPRPPATWPRGQHSSDWGLTELPDITAAKERAKRPGVEIDRARWISPHCRCGHPAAHVSIRDNDRRFVVHHLATVAPCEVHLCPGACGRYADRHGGPCDRCFYGQGTTRLLAAIEEDRTHAAR